jgi:hypothetical protein
MAAAPTVLCLSLAPLDAQVRPIAPHLSFFIDRVGTSTIVSHAGEQAGFRLYIHARSGEQSRRES